MGLEGGVGKGGGRGFICFLNPQVPALIHLFAFAAPGCT